MSVAELETKVRDRINQGRRQREYLGRLADWNRICSALDVVGDTELALDSYLLLPASDNEGICYLHVYGALQVLQTQQDAVANICDTLGIKTSVRPQLPEIRSIRSDSVGHPVRSKRDNLERSNFIVRFSLSQFTFTLMTVYSDGTPYEQKTISVPQLIASQRSALSSVLGEVLERMDEMEKEHREKFKDEKLSDVFPDVLGYYFSKIHEALLSSQYRSLGEMHVKLVGNCLDSFREALEKREEWGIYDPIGYEYELLEYPIDELLRFFEDPDNSKLNNQDARIFTEFVQKHINVLRNIAAEIDQKHQKESSGES